MTTKLIISRTLRLCLAAFIAVWAGTVCYAQTRLLDKIIVFDAPSGKSLLLDKPSSLSSNQELKMPDVAGTAGQALTISSVSGNTVTLGWSTEAVSTATLSKRLSSDETTAQNATPTGLVLAVGANKKYRVAGVVRGNRVNSTTASSADKIVFTITGPSGTSYVSISVRCYNCAASTTGVPTYNSASSTTVSTSAIDPAGSGTLNYTTFAYGVEGLILTGSSSGSVSILIDDDGTGDSSVFIAADSYLVLTEIN